jgi:hypothetical protein
MVVAAGGEHHPAFAPAGLTGARAQPQIGHCIAVRPNPVNAVFARKRRRARSNSLISTNTPSKVSVTLAPHGYSGQSDAGRQNLWKSTPKTPTFQPLATFRLRPPAAWRAASALHGLVIAKPRWRSYLISSSARRRDRTERLFREQAMTSRHMERYAYPPVPFPKADAAQSPCDTKEQEFVKKKGAKLTRPPAFVDTKSRNFDKVAHKSSLARLRLDRTQSGDQPRPVRRHHCVLVTQTFTAEFDNAVF